MMNVHTARRTQVFDRAVPRSALTFLLACLAMSEAKPAQATEVGGYRNLGLGLALGDPGGLVGKLYAGDRRNALDFGLGFWRSGWRGYCWRDRHGYRYCDGAWSYGHMSIHADYLWQFPLVNQGNIVLDWHVGMGGRLWFFNLSERRDSDFAVAARVPIGFDLMFHNPGRLELFLEIAPVLHVVPDSWLEIVTLSLGGRVYF